MGIDLEMAKKGVTVPRVALLDQSAVSAKLRDSTIEALKENGWKEEDTKEYDRLVSEVGSRSSEQVIAKVDKRGSTAHEQTALSNAKQYKRKLDLAAKDLVATKQLPVTDYQALLAGEAIGRSTPKMVGYLIKAGPIVQKHDALFSPYWKGQSAHACLAVVKKELEGAQATQEFNVASAPEETQKVYESMGKLLSLIERLNRIGRMAFDGDAVKAAQFNKDLILRARVKKGKKDEGEG